MIRWRPFCCVFFLSAMLFCEAEVENNFQNGRSSTKYMEKKMDAASSFFPGKTVTPSPRDYDDNLHKEKNDGSDNNNNNTNHHHHQHDIHWGYDNDGESLWPGHYPQCSGHRQSPVNIISRDVLPMKSFDEVSFEVVKESNMSGAIVTNNGHTVSLKFDGHIRLYWDRLDSPYHVYGAHFHWGTGDAEGSEHRINGQSYPLEVHIVTYDGEKYSSLHDAINGNDSIAVYGILFEISKEDNKQLSSVVEVLQKVTYPGLHTVARSQRFDTLLPVDYQTRYYHYKGSLTTPPCTENVLWLLAKEKLSISTAQLKEFRKLYNFDAPKGSVGAGVNTTIPTDNHTVAFNWRKPQPLHDRRVYATFPSQESQALEKPGGNSASVLRPKLRDLGILAALTFFLSFLF